MVFRVVFHPAATQEIDDLFDMIASTAGPMVAERYIEGLLEFIESLEAFPMRGTIRESKIEGLRIIGYSRRVSIGFAVEGNTVLILGVFAKGRNVTPVLLADRL